jgi:N-methylhydantoinase B/oxoprolinase/acetone carboxylase alpha subunit
VHLLELGGEGTQPAKVGLARDLLIRIGCRRQVVAARVRDGVDRRSHRSHARPLQPLQHRPRSRPAARYPLRKGDLVRLVTGTGGGFGEPRERERELLLADLEDGVVTEREARDVYESR